MLSIRAVVIDHYISKISQEFYEDSEPNLDRHSLEPVIRIYGSTPDGLKSCIHVHGVYPYMYVPCKGGDNTDRDAIILGAALDEALKITYNQHKTKFIHKVCVTSGIPLYGYHSGSRLFYKIYFYNPYHIKKASELLLNGAILNQKLQPHESHIPYVLQFMIDYNIYGMSFVDFRKIRFRGNPENSELLTGIDSKGGVSLSKMKKMTCCYLEGDAFAIDITNRNASRGLSSNPGLCGIWQSEKIRRKKLNLPSQFTVEESLSRRLYEPQATEQMYKDHLAKKLRDAFVEEDEEIKRFEEPELVYPGEAAINEHFLEASAIAEDLNVSSVNVDNGLLDVSIFIDEKVVSQQMGHEVAEDIEGTEVGSILGKNQKEGVEGAELENEEDDEDGGDMTQPLDVDEQEDVAASCGSRSNAESQEVDFWRKMGDKILQIDGAQDSSSDSDVGSNLKTAAAETRTPNCFLLEKDFLEGSDSTRCLQAVENSKTTIIARNSSVPDGAGSILTFLPENGTASVPIILSQPLSAIWSGFTQKDCSLAPPPTLESWSWDKNEVPFADLFVPRNQVGVVSACDFGEAVGSKSSQEVSNSDDSLRSLLGSNHLFDTYGEIPSLSLCNNIITSYSESSPASVFPSPTQFETYADVNMNSIASASDDLFDSTHGYKDDSALNSSVKSKEVPSPSVGENQPPKKLSSSPSNKSVSLTLKQYLKDFGEIVNVDLKIFNDREMVVIEYKPYNVTTPGQNKFLIKPLDKFLENWNSAEKKVSQELSQSDKISDVVENEAFKSTEANKNVIGRLNVNQLKNNFNRFKDLKLRGNRSPPNKTQEKEVFSGQATAKFFKSKTKKQKNTDKEHFQCHSCINSRRNKTVDERTSNDDNHLKRIECKSKLNESILNNWEEGGGSDRKKDLNLSRKSRKNWEEICENKVASEGGDVNLIKQINSCFEDYFRKVVKVNNSWSENDNNLYSSGIDLIANEMKMKRVRGLSENHPKRTVNFAGKKAEEDSESVKLVTQLLSAVSKMSQTREMPPLYITINIGNRGDSVSDSLRLNFPSSPNCIKRERGRNKMSSKPSKLAKFKIANVDGPADNSSSEDSVGSLQGEKRKVVRSPKKVKKDSHYRSLNIILQKSPPRTKKINERKRKRSGRPDADEQKEGVSGRRDSSDDFSQNQLSLRNRLRSSSKKKKTLRMNTTKSERDLIMSTSGSLKVHGPLSSTVQDEEHKEEPDIIYDSDEDIRSKAIALNRRSKKALKMKSKDISRVEKRKNLMESFQSKQKKKEIEVLEISDSDDPESTKTPGQSPCSQLESTFDMSLSELDKTRYRIPSKWFHSKKNTLTSTLALPQVENKNPNDFSPIEMPLSGSPLCSPASNQVAQPSKSRSPPENDSNLRPYGMCLNERDLSYCSSAGIKPIEFLGFGSLSEAEETNQISQIISLSDAKVVCPVRKPPTWNEVKSFVIDNRNVREEVQVPFYSDSADLTKVMEIGPLVLKVETTAYAGLKSFVSSLNLIGVEKTRRLLLNTARDKEFRHLLVADSDITITPLRKPPMASLLVKSVESKKSKKEEEKIKSKTKVILPLSPGQESHSEEEMDINLSVSTLREEEEIQLGSEEFSLNVDSKTGIKKSSQSGSSRKSIKDLLSDFASLKKSFSGSGDICQGHQKSTSLHIELESSAVKTSIPSTSSESNSDLNTKVQKRSENSFQIRGPTLENTFGFDHSVENLQNAKLGNTYQYVTMLVMEVHVRTREDLRPDPCIDPIRALFYNITFDSPNKKEETGVIVVGDVPLKGSFRTFGKVHRVEKELDLILKIVDLIKEWDPDILAGYEIEMHSWGYLIQRAFSFQLTLFSMLGRVVSEQSANGKPSFEKDDFDDVPSSIRNLRIPGRIVLDIWRVLRHEMALTSYTFENVTYHLSHERHPLLSYRDLSFYWDHSTHLYRHIALDYYFTRVTGIVQILNRLDFINRTSEFARLFGIQFYEVLSRGSQFRVESMMLRMAKPLNYVPVSPSIGQRAAMRAPASLPLILEPESAYYTDPLIVLDFQSLYPSMIIAYNYCFSTCLGRVENLGGRKPYEFGCTQLQISPEELKALERDITISPAGVAFVKENVRKGILPAMLEEILEARLMVKKSMKNNKNDKLLQKVLFAQQLGLKLIANVTYGYTAANFSGRMPSIEVGDSVVSKGRETLQRAIHLIKNNPKWNARVVYGDTDSIFVLTPGRSRSEAFQIGAEIAEAVTCDNPKPVKLKLEKVYQPSILQTKKRYVGYMYESPDQTKPTFDAKGIETVRRDGCPAVGKILRKALEILFETNDVSLVKKYVLRQFSKIFQGRVNLQDLIFAKEYRGRNGYRPGACVPALQLARQWTQLDRRAEPRVKERVPYVIVSGPPGVPLIKLVRSPMDLVLDSGLHINAFYYITKAIIPPLHRCFSLMGVDVASWYAQMPKKLTKRYKANLPKDIKRTTISQYFTTVECLACSNITISAICQECLVRPQVYVSTLADKIARWEKCFSDIAKICQSCCKSPKEFNCQSVDCPILFRKAQASRDLLQIEPIRDILSNSTGVGVNDSPFFDITENYESPQETQ